MAALSVLQLFSYGLFIATTFASPPATTAAAGLAVRADLTHVDSGRGFTKREMLRRMVARSRARAATLHLSRGHGARTVTAPVARGTVGAGAVGSEYLIHFGIGTPRPQHVALTLDTGSDLIWTQCEPCNVCFDQPLPVFDPSASATSRAVPCSDHMCGNFSVTACYKAFDGCFFLYTYGDKSITAGQIIKDTATFKVPNGKGGGGMVTLPELGIGCGLFNTGIYDTNESGIAGFGRGPMSLPSQLKVGKFSYCFTNMFESKSSPVFLGSPDDLRAHATGPIQSTPFARNPSGDTTSYLLSLDGITVGKTRLPDVPAAAVAAKKTAMIDSGTSVTHLPEAVYAHLRSAFVSQVRLPVANTSDGLLCFSAASAAAARKAPVPRLVFHLEGADWDMPRDNYVFVDENSTSLCLAISGSVGSGGDTIIGNFQQQNMHIVYDLENNKLVFAPAQCDKL